MLSETAMARSHSAPQHHHADLGEVRLHYVTAGDGDPVVLLHGWPQTWYCWRKIIPKLTPQHFVIAPDLRGLGDSSGPGTGYDCEDLGAVPDRGSDPRYDRPWCPAFDLSTTGSGAVPAAAGPTGACPDRGLAVNRAPSQS
jgi:pimeloyl-ACP methyl ester carboxylesterase